ncbi:17803_t:CDS:2 [Funneliformis caledonium]|uniref:17803_t:CDS:1 n=1 Tax=Funneliformis caledonium TaxID=1117310 RepID=A0A9N9BXB8_9GLOM|nr:17803_t:CDS:2 [Funneliformis caledonium]
MNQVEEDTRTKEQETLAKELDWLLVSQLPTALYEIKKGLKAQVLWQYRQIRFITLDGSDIIKGELSVKLSNYHRGNLIKLNINSKKPYFIEQLVDAQNYLTLALDSLEHTNKDLTKESARELLDSVLIYILSSRSVLVCAHEEKLFPYKICDPQMFGTAIPEELVIQFHVEGSNVISSVYGLQYHSSLPSQKKNEEVMEGLMKLERECLAWKGKIALFKNLELGN